MEMMGNKFLFTIFLILNVSGYSYLFLLRELRVLRGEYHIVC